MTRPLSDVLRVVELADQGWNKAAIAREVGVSRERVKVWTASDRDALLRSHEMATREQLCDGSCSSVDHLPVNEYALLLGYYLGDGCISLGRKGVYALRIICADAYPGLMDECAAAMRAVVPSNSVVRIRREGCTEVVMTWKHWPCVFPQHGPGMKHQRGLDFPDWQIQLIAERPTQVLRGLIMSDGCRVQNYVQKRKYHYTRYHFSNASKEIQELFILLCEDLELKWTRNHSRMLSISKREDVEYLDKFVGPKH